MPHWWRNLSCTLYSIVHLLVITGTLGVKGTTTNWVVIGSVDTSHCSSTGSSLLSMYKSMLKSNSETLSRVLKAV